MKITVIIAFAYIAAVIGAGFASGAEVVSFFLVYGKESILGLLTASVFFGIFSYAMLEDCRKNGICDFGEYLEFLMPPFFKKLTFAVVFVFMTVCLAAMAAAAGEILKDIFNIPQILGVIIFSAVTALTLCFSVSGITKVNAVLGAFIAAGIILGSIYIINFRFLETFNPIIKITVSSVSYTAYNGISAAVILCSMSRFLKTKRQSALTALLIGAGILVILGALWCVVGIYYGKVELGEIPMLSIASRQGKWFYVLYSIVLFLAVFSTAVSNGFGVTEYIKKFTSGKIAVLTAVLCMIILSAIGFSAIVDVVYRLCGYASLILPVFMVIKRVKIRKSKKNQDI